MGCSCPRICTGLGGQAFPLWSVALHVQSLQFYDPITHKPADPRGVACSEAHDCNLHFHRVVWQQGAPAELFWHVLGVCWGAVVCTCFGQAQKGAGSVGQQVELKRMVREKKKRMGVLCVIYVFVCRANKVFFSLMSKLQLTERVIMRCRSVWWLQ